MRTDGDASLVAAKMSSPWSSFFCLRPQTQVSSTCTVSSNGVPKRSCRFFIFPLPDQPAILEFVREMTLIANQERCLSLTEKSVSWTRAARASPWSVLSNARLVSPNFVKQNPYPRSLWSISLSLQRERSLRCGSAGAAMGCFFVQ